MLPKIRDSWSYLYVERCRIDREDNGIAVQDERGRVRVPCAMLSTLMLGPGTSVTHAAISTLADNGCLVAWCGEEGVRFYALGTGETRSSRNLLRQVRLYAISHLRHAVVMQMYRMRFAEPLLPGLTLRQIRGLEGVRVREAYAEASREWGVPWHGRSYKRAEWSGADTVNRALSVANSCLYGVAHAAIVSAGYSPGVGFIHTGKMLSFVYDVADLYKTETTIPTAFAAATEGDHDLEGRVRRVCREAFGSVRLLDRIVRDIDAMLGSGDQQGSTDDEFDSDEARPGGLWDPNSGQVKGGMNHSNLLAPT